jgi:hypothetical protein
MDRERFGRALGVGTREAAKALLKAANAAAAPNPRAGHAGAGAVRPATGQVVAAQVQRAKVTTAGVKRGGKRFGEAVWAPVVKASGVLWLEVTGVLFGMFAVAAAVAVWRDRGNFKVGGPPTHHAWFALGMFVVFGYFTVSSYVRAARRERR